MTLRVYNTLTRQKEEFMPLEPPKVKMYNCGPTVYDYFHIGNARNFVVMDVIRRYLTYKGYQVKFVQNITDIDDKIIHRAQEEEIPAKEVAEKYTRVYFEEASRLGVKPADVHPKATEHIQDMIKLIERLVEKGHAYVANGDVYFRVTSYKSYGELSGKKLDELQKGFRVEVDEKKEDPIDFALWKAAKEGEPYWESPWGKGRPGWHIECSTMAIIHLAETIDIHSGGVDLIFPHHENERAQSESATGKPFVRYWLHNGFLKINNQKMSKSLGNFLIIDQVLERYNASVVRLFLLSAHYRHPLDFTEENIQDAERAMKRITDCLATSEKLLETLPPEQQIELDGRQNSKVTEILQNYRATFEEAMDDDFNTGGALGVIFDLVGEMNALKAAITEKAKHREVVGVEMFTQLMALHKLLEELLSILGFSLEREASARATEEALIELLIEVRQALREQKHWELADQIRQALNELDIILEDLPQQTIWRKK